MPAPSSFSLVELLEPRQLLNAGAVDTSFGKNGSTLIPGLAYFLDLAVQDSGKILILGMDGDPASPASHSHLLRLSNDGTVDSSFHAQAPAFNATHIFLESNGKILLFGITTNNGTLAHLIRYNADGSADTTFHGGSDVQTTISNFSSKALRQSDGKIVVPFLYDVPTSDPGEHFNFGVTRLTADGTLDPAFGEQGQAIAAGSVGSPGALPHTGALIDKDGNIAVVGGIATSEGSTDALYSVVFGPDGNGVRNGGIALPFLSEDRFGGGIVYNDGIVRPDDTPVVTLSGEDLSSIYVAVGNHLVTLDPDPAVAGVVHDGNVINAGNNTVEIGGIEGREISVTRLAADGNPDPAYGFAGISAPLRIAPRNSSLGSIVIAPSTQGAIVTAGTVYGRHASYSQVYVARFTGGSPSTAQRGPIALLDPVPDFVIRNSTGKRHLSFDVKFTAAGGIDQSTLDNGDVRVVGPNGFSQLAGFAGIDTFPGSNNQYAIYTILGPGGHWNLNDNGVYHVQIRRRQVRDQAQRPLAAGEIGQFVFNPAATPSVERAIVNGANNTIFNARHSINEDLLA